MYFYLIFFFAEIREAVTGMAEVNPLDCNESTNFFSFLFEHTPLVAAAAWSKRPFSNVSAFTRRAVYFVVDQLEQDAQTGLLMCYPDLAGRLAMQGRLSTSTKEQSLAGWLSLTEEEFRRMDKQNRLYKEKLEFPFVTCVRENKKEAILQGFGQRLPHSVSEKMKIAIGEMKKIAWHGLQDLVKSPTSSARAYLWWSLVSGLSFVSQYSGVM